MENKGYREFPVISNEAVVENIYRMDLGGDFIAEPGQFFMLRSKGAGPLLSRPLSICDISQGYLTFLYAVVGEGTAILSRKRPGDAVQLLGPLGNSYKVKSERKTALIGGGIGIAPLLYIAKTAEIKPDIYLGFRDAPFFEKEFEAYAGKLQIATETGGVGYRGFVTDIRNWDDYDELFACGPMPMLKALSRKVVDCELYLSLEAHMACGIGACLGCAVETVHGMKRVCKDGPIFSAKELIL
ncbi:MAG: dihydroorotate dehydrogenase electron transfer subunit [Clostridiales bacterium]|nr:dihydroorotate dehydrogenase electron transfer subunit [Clostridiales bacterium]